MFYELFTLSTNKEGSWVEEFLQTLFELKEDGIKDFLDFILGALSRNGVTAKLAEKLVQIVSESNNFSQDSKNLI